MVRYFVGYGRLSQNSPNHILSQIGIMPANGTKDKNQRNSDALGALIDLMRRLRDPDDGCAWDLAQDHASLVPHTIEEAYEVAEAVANGDPEALCDELGDLLLQVIFQAQIASESGRFFFADIAEAVIRKLISRHPHIFGEMADSEGVATGASAGVGASADGFHRRWEAIKAEERQAKGETRVLDGIASSLPPVIRALKLQGRAARVGFDWPDARSVMDKLREEMAEMETEINHVQPDKSRLTDEMGDLLFVVINLARKLDIDPEQALASTNRKFVDRFNYVEDQAEAEGQPLERVDLERMERWWQQAKSGKEHE